MFKLLHNLETIVLDRSLARLTAGGAPFGGPSINLKDRRFTHLAGKLKPAGGVASSVEESPCPSGEKKGFLTRSGICGFCTAPRWLPGATKCIDQGLSLRPIKKQIETIFLCCREAL